MAVKIKEQTEEIKKQRIEIVKSVIDAQEIERQRLSRELHDGVGQMLSAVNMRLERAKIADKNDSEEILSVTQGMVKNIISEIRTTSNNLMPNLLNELGLSSAISNLCEDINNNNINLKITYQTNIQRKINSPRCIYIYRIVQEAINNIVKHARATSAKIQINYSENRFFVEIEDNGIGFNKNMIKIGSGLINMKERTELVGGKFEINSVINKGTIIKIEILDYA
jgi:signal transduction histidine kinase